MIDLVRYDMDVLPSTYYSDRRLFVMQTVVADDDTEFGLGPEKPAPRFVHKLVVWLLAKIGPKGKEFGIYSLEYYTIRNSLCVNRVCGVERVSEHIPE